MNNENEHDELQWIHPLLVKAVDVSVDDRVKEVQDWYTAKAPYLTDRAKTVLKLVEKMMKLCDKCEARDSDFCSDIDRDIPGCFTDPSRTCNDFNEAYSELFKAYKGKEA